MSPDRFPRTAVLTASLLVLGACASSKPKEGLVQAEDMVGCVERVYVEAELANARADEALSSLQLLVSAEFEGDGTQAYVDFVEAIERSTEQAEALRTTVEPLRSSAQSYFERWEASLGTFTSDTLRSRSQSRLEEARSRYESVLASVEPAQQIYDALNVSFKDHAAFLAHDFNAGALADIEPEVEALAELTDELEGDLQACLQAAQEYLRSASLPERVEVSAGSAEEGKRKGRS